MSYTQSIHNDLHEYITHMHKSQPTYNPTQRQTCNMQHPNSPHSSASRIASAMSRCRDFVIRCRMWSSAGSVAIEQDIAFEHVWDATENALDSTWVIVRSRLWSRWVSEISEKHIITHESLRTACSHGRTFKMSCLSHMSHSELLVARTNFKMSSIMIALFSRTSVSWRAKHPQPIDSALTEWTTCAREMSVQMDWTN